MVARLFIFLVMIGCSLGLSQNSEQDPATIIAAGVPKPLGESKNFELIFRTLSEAGMSVFFPTFQYKEIPEAKSLGLETQFLPPCQPLNPALTAMLQENISLLVPGELLYPQLPAPFPTLEEDPLQALSSCLGEQGIFAVYSYDEPVGQGVSLESVKRFYERVKDINPQLPVMMIHKPLLADDEALQTPEQKTAYLDKVKSYSQYTDIVGFDVYPIPAHIAQVISPYTVDYTTDYRILIADYLKWLRAELPDKQLALVLQGFSYTNQYEDSFLRENFPDDLLATVRAPSKEELSEMVRVVLEYDAYIIWWGQSFLEKADLQLWEDILSVSQNAR
jgi:hypothetical protein